MKSRFLRFWPLLLPAVLVGVFGGLNFFQYLMKPAPTYVPRASNLPPLRVYVPMRDRQILSPDTASTRDLLKALQYLQPLAAQSALNKGANPNGTLCYRTLTTNPKTTTPNTFLAVVVMGVERQVVGGNDVHHREIVALFRLLLQHGYKIHAKDEMGRDALYWAIYAQDAGLVSDLLKQGANPNSTYDIENYRGMIGANPLLSAMRWGAGRPGGLPTIRALLVAGANPNRYGNDGSEEKTALHSAALLDDPEVITLLLKYGADPTLPTKPKPPQNPK